MTPDYRLYLVTDDNLTDSQLCQVVEAALKGGVTMVQLRDKQGDVRRFLHRAQLLKPIVQAANVPLIINDRVDVALAIDADGVHLGQSDLPVADARRLLGEDKILGLTVESPEQLLQAQTWPVDYLGISTVFATETKTDTQYVWQLSGLSQAQQDSQLPLVAIGGIHQNNLTAVWQTGVAGIALVSAICSAEDPYSASAALLAQLHSRI